MNSYESYLTNFKTKFSNVVEPEFLWNCPSLEGAKQVVHNVWKLSDGRVVKRNFNGSHESFQVWPSSDAYHGHVSPLSENQFFHG
jgi:hypothetical protein